MNLWETLESEGVLRSSRLTRRIRAKSPASTFEEILRDELRRYYRTRMELVWELVKQPIPIPDRKRRRDREIPKAA